MLPLYFEKTFEELSVTCAARSPARSIRPIGCSFVMSFIVSGSLAIIAATARRALDWLRQACVECSSAYSLAWSAFAFLMHDDPALDGCIADLRTALFRKQS